MERLNGGGNSDLTEIYRDLSLINTKINGLTTDLSDLNDDVDTLEIKVDEVHDFKMYYIQPKTDTRIYFNAMSTSPFDSSSTVSLTLPVEIIYCYFVNIIHRSLTLTVNFNYTGNYHIYCMNCKLNKITVNSPSTLDTSLSNVGFIEFTKLKASEMNYSKTLKSLTINNIDSGMPLLNLSDLVALQTLDLYETTLSNNTNISLNISSNVRNLRINCPHSNIYLTVDKNLNGPNVMSRFYLKCYKLMRLICNNNINLTTTKNTNNFYTLISQKTTLGYIRVNWKLLWLLQACGNSSSVNIDNLIIESFDDSSDLTIDSSWNSSYTSTNNWTIKRLNYISGPHLTLTDFMTTFKTFINANLTYTNTICTGLN